MIFRDEQALTAYLGLLNPYYPRYAAALWCAEFNSTELLANASVQSLMDGGVSLRNHAEDMKGQAGV